MDDLIAEAQDFYFEMDMDSAAASARKALKLSPTERDARDILTLALLGMQPPPYQEIIQLYTDLEEVTSFLLSIRVFFQTPN